MQGVSPKNLVIPERPVRAGLIRGLAACSRSIFCGAEPSEAVEQPVSVASSVDDVDAALLRAGADPVDDAEHLTVLADEALRLARPQPHVQRRDPAAAALAGDRQAGAVSVADLARARTRELISFLVCTLRPQIRPAFELSLRKQFAHCGQQFFEGRAWICALPVWISVCSFTLNGLRAILHYDMPFRTIQYVRVHVVCLPVPGPDLIARGSERSPFGIGR